MCMIKACRKLCVCNTLKNTFLTISFFFITARIRSMKGRYCFHRCLSVNISGGGVVPRSGLDGRGVPHPRSGQGSGWWLGGGWGLPGVPPPRPEMGYPPDLRWGTPPPITQSSIASTCYAAGGVPLVFTQEDFLFIGFIDFFYFIYFYLFPNRREA